MRLKRAAVLAWFVAVLAFSATGWAQVRIYVSINATRQGPLKGEARDPRRGGSWTPCLRYFYQVTSPLDAATGLSSGRKQRSPILFTKEWGGSSPQLYQAMVTNEVLKTVIFEFVRTGPGGEERVFQRVTLTDATVSSIKQFVNYPQDAAPPDARALEDVSLAFRTLRIENEEGSTSVIDDRMAP